MAMQSFLIYRSLHRGTAEVSASPEQENGNRPTVDSGHQEEIVITSPPPATSEPMAAIVQEDGVTHDVRNRTSGRSRGIEPPAMPTARRDSPLTSAFKACGDPECSALGQCKFTEKKFVSEKSKTAYPQKFHEYLKCPTDIIVSFWGEDGSRTTKSIKNAKTIPKTFKNTRI